MNRASSVGAFVRARRSAWERLDVLAHRSGPLPLESIEELDRLYRRVAGDLAYARSAFPGSEAEGFLAEVTARAYGALYRPARPGLGAIWRLVSAEVPETFRRHLRALYLALAFFGAGLVAGALAVWADPGSARILVPDAVRDAVAEGRLWTNDLLSAAPGLSSSLIAHNNVTVAVLAFGLGLTFGVGTALLLLANGLLLGAVFSFVAQNGMLSGLLAFVAAHGPAEISALLLAAQGGLVLAGALVDPGEWPRRTALAARGREAVRLLLLVVPILGLVALVEGSISPGSRFPTPAKVGLGLALSSSLWGYLVFAGKPVRTGSSAARP